MTPTRWLLFGAVCLVILGGLVAVSKRDSVNVSGIDPNVLVISGDTADHIYGKKDSKVILVEYGDFQCPSCGGAYKPLKALTDAYKDHIAFVFRNFPLTAIHPNALAAASAAEAANKQGKYWEMHDKLYETQSTWENASTSERTSVFSGYAKSLGINTSTFETDLTSKIVANKINYDRAIGGKVGVDATPTFILNGQKVDTATASSLVEGNNAAIKTKIDAALKEAGDNFSASL